jgi:hypothetical protein
MKKLFTLIIIAILLIPGLVSAQGGGSGVIVPAAQTVTLRWDANPIVSSWTEVRIYEIVGTQYIRVATVPGDQTQAVIVGVIPGVHTYIARSFSVWESIDSNTVATPGFPGAPTGFTITVSGG